MQIIAPAAVMAAALLLTGCGDDDEAGGLGSAGLSGGAGGEGGEGEDSGGLGEPDIDDIELETTGGFGGDSEDSGGGSEGSDDWYAHWESDGITLYTTADGVLYGNSGTSTVCTQDSGVEGGLDWEPVLFSCNDPAFASVILRLNGDTMAIEWDDRTEEVAMVENLAGQTVDLASLETTILD